MTQIHKDIKKCGVSHGGRGNMEFSNSSSEATVSFWRKKIENKNFKDYFN